MSTDGFQRVRSRDVFVEDPRNPTCPVHRVVVREHPGAHGYTQQVAVCTLCNRELAAQTIAPINVRTCASRYRELRDAWHAQPWR